MNAIIDSSMQVPLSESQYFDSDVQRATMDWVLVQKSEGTRKAYITDIREFCSRYRPRHPAEITVGDITRWRDHLLGKGREPATVARKLSSLSSFLDWMVAEGVVASNQAKRVSRPVVQNGDTRRTMTRNQVKEVLKVQDPTTPRGSLEQAILRLLFHGGLRRNEVSTLNVGDLGEDLGQPTLKIMGKRSQRRTILLHPQAHIAIRQYLSVSRRDADSADSPLFVSWKWVFASDRRYKRLSTSAIYQIVRRNCETAIGDRRSPHDARSSAVTRSFDEHSEIDRVCEHFGFSAAMALRYRGLRGRIENSIANLINY